MQTVKDKILGQIRRKPAGYAFSPKDFLNLGSRGSIDVALSALVQDGLVRRITRGIYDRPRFSDILGKHVPPDIDQVVQALARKHGWRIQATGAMAANMLGLSTQVPAKVVYIIDGPGKSIKVGNTTVQFKRAAPKDLNVQNPKSALVIQALKFLGKTSANKRVLSQISGKLSVADRRKLLRDARFGTDWIFEAVKTICDKEDT
jgi:hypothetical protein